MSAYVTRLELDSKNGATITLHRDYPLRQFPDPVGEDLPSYFRDAIAAWAGSAVTGNRLTAQVMRFWYDSEDEQVRVLVQVPEPGILPSGGLPDVESLPPGFRAALAEWVAPVNGTESTS